MAFFCTPALAQPERPQSDLDKLIAKTIPSVVRIYGAGGFTSVPAYGSGVIVHERGFILTAWSISLRTDSLKVVDHRGYRYPAEIWRADPGLGVALLKIKSRGAAGFTALRLSSSAGLESGTPLVSFGNPFGFLYGNERPAVMRGVITAITEPGRGGFRLVRFPRRLEQIVLSDIPNNPGTQGGPVLTLQGELIGIQGRLIESRATNTILNFTVPADAIRAFVSDGVSGPAQPEAPDPPAKARQAPAQLGLHLQRAHLVRSPLPYVERVAKDSPAAKAGVQPDDLVFRVGARTIRSCRDYDEALTGLKPGSTVRVVVKRGEVMLALQVTVPEESGQ